MVRSLLFLKPVGGDCAAIERFFADEGVLERASRLEGYLGGELQLPAEPGAPALVTALWSSPQAYRSWLDDPWRAKSSARGKAVFEPVEQPGGGGSLYEVAIVVPARRGGAEGKAR